MIGSLGATSLTCRQHRAGGSSYKVVGHDLTDLTASAGPAADNHSDVGVD